MRIAFAILLLTLALLGNAQSPLGSIRVPLKEDISLATLRSEIGAIDLDGNGSLEILESTFSPIAMRARTLQGLTAGPSFEIPGRPKSIYIDLNNDGLIDVATPNGNSVNVTLSTSALVWGQGVQLPGSFGIVETVGSADLNGDGLLDLFTAQGSVGANQNRFGVWLNQGSGSFGQVQQGGLIFTAEYAFAPDYNGDGRIDIAFACRNNEAAVVGFKQQEDGSFSVLPDTLYVGDLSDASQFQHVDLTGDGLKDLLFGTAKTSGQVCAYLPASPTAGYGTSVLVGTAGTPGSFGRFDFQVKDLDGDGNLDIAASVNRFSRARIETYLGDGRGGFTSRQQAYVYTDAFPIIRGMVGADLNGDGFLEMFFLDESRGDIDLAFLGNVNGELTTFTVLTAFVDCDDKGTPAQLDDQLSFVFLAAIPSGGTANVSINVGFRYDTTFNVSNRELATIPIPLAAGAVNSWSVDYSAIDDGTSVQRTGRIGSLNTCSSGPAQFTNGLSSLSCNPNFSASTETNNDDDSVTWNFKGDVFGPNVDPFYFFETNAGIYIDSDPRLDTNQYSFFQLSHRLRFDLPQSSLPDTIYFKTYNQSDSALVFDLKYLNPRTPCSFIPVLDSFSVLCDNNQTLDDASDDLLDVAVNFKAGHPNQTFRPYVLNTIDISGTRNPIDSFDFNATALFSLPATFASNDSLRLIANIDQYNQFEITAKILGSQCSVLSATNSLSKAHRWQIHPNPTQGVLRFSSTSISNTTSVNAISLINIWGQRVIHEKVVAGSSFVLESNLPPGHYTCHMKLSDGSSETLKVLIIN